MVTATPVSTRGRPERAAGTQVSLAAIRSIVDGAVPFRAFVGSVHDSLVQALAHCSVAADSVAWRQTGGHSLFSTLLTCCSGGRRRGGSASLTVELLDAGPVEIQGQLELYLWQDPTLDATIDGHQRRAPPGALMTMPLLGGWLLFLLVAGAAGRATAPSGYSLSALIPRGAAR